MARPKEKDPKEKVPLRLRKSKIKHLKELAKGHSSVAKLIEHAIDKTYPI